MVLTIFKRYFRNITCLGLIILSASTQANTGIFDDLMKSEIYERNLDDAYFLTEKYKDAIQQASDITVSEKTLLLDCWNRYLNNTCAYFKNLEAFAQLCFPAEIVNQKQLIKISPMLLLKYYPVMFFYNLYLHKQAEHEYKQHQSYWDAQLKKQTKKNIDPMFALIKELQPKNFKYPGELTNKSGTLTEQHMINSIYIHSQITLDDFKDAFITSPVCETDSPVLLFSLLLLDNTLPKAIAAEQTFKASGYETFFHARRWNWNFVNDICNLVTSIHNPAEYHANKHLLRFRPPNCDTDILYQYRTQLVNFGPDTYVNSGFDYQGAKQETTCMNKTILSNITFYRYGECTSEYYIFNHSCAYYDAERNMLEKIIEEYDLVPYFKKYAKEIKKLIALHKKLQEYGELLCIAIKRKYVFDMIYAATPGAIKYHKTAQHCIQNDLQAFSDPYYLDFHLECYNSASRLSRRNYFSYNDYPPTEPRDYNDQDCHFYCFAVSDIPGEYNNKYVIESICTGDAQQYAQYCTERDALFAKIKAEYIKDHTQN